MAGRRLQLTDAVYDYLAEVSVKESPVLQKLRAETAKLPGAGMQIGADQGQFMRLLIRLMGASRAIEIGVFTGYSSICIAEALGPSGKLIACDVSDEYTRVARRYWQEAGVAHRIELRLKPALETLAELRAQGQDGSFDFAFIDADKENGSAYYNACCELIRAGGLIAIDNALWGGSVADPSDRRETTLALRELNRRVASDSRVEASLIPVGDGLMLARKR